MSVPRVTVAIPVYNGAKTLQRCLESVFGQTFKDFEVLVVDDGSTDGSPEIAERMGCRVVCQGRLGNGAARKRLVEESRTELIAWIDCDDEWEPDKLERQVPIHDDPEVVLSHTSGIHVFPDGSTVPHPIHPGRDEYAFDHLLPVNRILGPSGVFRRDKILEAGNFDERPKVGCEYFGNMRLAKMGRFVFLPERLYRYYEHDQQMSVKSLAYRYKEMETFHYLLEEMPKIVERLPPKEQARYIRYLKQRIGWSAQQASEYLKQERKNRREYIRLLWKAALYAPTYKRYWYNAVRSFFFW